ncbi:MAG: precorrin-8X methylmutase [Candidatus Nitrosopelagicus sp.]|jgi:precorrin-8X/cobalt-precorrin-8 methylmutase|nr:precorrin-8X methylmutase [Candidatus Nitrosopelagicus sp.]
MQTRKGQEIEDESMQIIENEIGAHTFNEMEWPIVRRIIHSTADFDFAGENKLLFHKDAISNGINALKNGCSIVTDVNGVIGLMNKQNPKDFGNNLICNISDSSLMESAKKAGKTRAQMSMRVAEKEIDGGIVVVGNAPTALLEVMDMVREGLVKPALVVGIPVGFVSAVESKDELSKTDIPFITNIGRKGGSPCASAIINALYKLLRQGIN